MGFAVSLVWRLFSAWCRALPAVCAAPPTAGDPSGFLPFSGRICLPYCCTGGVGLCSLFRFPCLRVGALLASGVCRASWLRGLCSLGCPSWLVLLLMSLSVLHLLLQVRLFGQSFGPSCCSCVLRSRGVSAAAFCHLGLLSCPLLLLFLAWVSSFGICSGLG